MSEAETERAHKSQEIRLRRKARRQHLTLVKSRLRDPQAYGYGGYLLTDYNNRVVCGAGPPFDFNLTLDDVEKYLRHDNEQSEEA